MVKVRKLHHLESDGIQGNERRSFSAKKIVRQHNFASKVILKQETCIPCKTR